MEKRPLISVIVPVYKVEQYLDRCVQSIVDQTWKNLEIILVDDGSPDGCARMCDEWARRDARIRVIHKENGGLSDARNAGMAAATGESIGFVDGDDWIEPDMYRLLVEQMERTQSDIAACGVEMVWEDDTPPRRLTKEGSCVLEAEEAMRAVIEESWIKAPVWYKLYRTELVRSIPFPVGKCHEDVFWTYQAVGRAKRVAVFDTLCYHYLQRAGSIMDEGFSLKRLDALEAKVNRLRYIERNNPELLSLAKRELWFFCMYSRQMLLKHCPKETADEGAGIIRRVLRDCPIQICCWDGKNVKQFIWLVLAKTSFELACRLRSALGIGF